MFIFSTWKKDFKSQQCSVTDSLKDKNEGQDEEGGNKGSRLAWSVDNKFGLDFEVGTEARKRVYGAGPVVVRTTETEIARRSQEPLPKH